MARPEKSDRFGGVLAAVSEDLVGLSETPELAAELAAELDRLSTEIRSLRPDYPLAAGVAAALRMTDGAASAAAPLVRLAAEILADHAPSSGWGRTDLLDYFEGLGTERTAGFLEEVARVLARRR